MSFDKKERERAAAGLERTEETREKEKKNSEPQNLSKKKKKKLRSPTRSSRPRPRRPASPLGRARSATPALYRQPSASLTRRSGPWPETRKGAATRTSSWKLEEKEGSTPKRPRHSRAGTWRPRRLCFPTGTLLPLLPLLLRRLLPRPPLLPRMTTTRRAEARSRSRSGLWGP